MRQRVLLVSFIPSARTRGKRQVRVVGTGQDLRYTRVSERDEDHGNTRSYDRSQRESEYQSTQQRSYQGRRKKSEGVTRGSAYRYSSPAGPHGNAEKGSRASLVIYATYRSTEGTSENPLRAKFAELPFHALG